MILPMVREARRLAVDLYAKARPKQYKQAHELKYWKGCVSREGVLSNDHYKAFYTSFFDLSLSAYAGKRVLDIGCGPRGSLEWATMARERVGLDPLVPQYLKLNASAHRMTYVAADSHDIPFADDYFDVVCSFNSLDHVDDVDGTIREIKRVTRPDGTFLLIVEVNHPPTATEPISLGWSIVDAFTDAFELVDTGRFEIGNHDIYGQLRANARFDPRNGLDRPGIVTARFTKRAGA